MAAQAKEKNGIKNWQAVHFKYVQSAKTILPLPNGAIFTGKVDYDNLLYFRVDVPKGAIFTILLNLINIILKLWKFLYNYLYD